MPFDFATQTATAAYLSAGDGADWQAIAAALYAELTARPVKAPRKAKAALSPDAPEWEAYPEGKITGATHNGRKAVFVFSDGKSETVPLMHKKTKAAPDWARAARVAVSFYKARRVRGFMALVGQDRYELSPTWAEVYADGCAVPAIISGTDLTRNVTCDAAKANDHTAVQREGPAYLSQLVGAACAAGGDWEVAWKIATWQPESDFEVAIACTIQFDFYVAWRHYHGLHLRQEDRARLLGGV